MSDYPYWGGMSDTHELPACQIGRPMHEAPTSMIWPPAMRPEVTPTTPRGFGRLDRVLAAAACVSVAAIGGMVGVLNSLGVL